MEDWEERIGKILNDPGQMAEISRLAQQLMGGGANEVPNTPPPEPFGLDPGILASLTGLLREDSNGSPARAALQALLPALSPKRREKLSRAMRLAHVGRLALRAFGEERGHV